MRWVIGAVLAVCAVPAEAKSRIVSLDSEAVFWLLRQDCLVTDRHRETVHSAPPGGPLDTGRALSLSTRPTNLIEFERLKPLKFEVEPAALIGALRSYNVDVERADVAIGIDVSLSILALGTLDPPAFGRWPRRSMFDTMITVRIEDRGGARPAFALRGGLGSVLWRSIMIGTGKMAVPTLSIP